MDTMTKFIVSLSHFADVRVQVLVSNSQFGGPVDDFEHRACVICHSPSPERFMHEEVTPGPGGSHV